MSPYMIGPYYKPQLTSMLSIASRLTGVFLTAVTLPLFLWWVLALMTGPEAFAMVTEFLSGLIGRGIVLFSTFAICYHLMNGIRHLVWDTASMLEIKDIYQSGYIMVAASIALFVLTLWLAS